MSRIDPHLQAIYNKQNMELSGIKKLYLPSGLGKLQGPAPKTEAAAPVLDNSPVESTEFAAQSRHREPEEAIKFLNGIDEQLGLSPEMRQEKRELMSESSHAFFRASPSLFYHDLQTTYQKSSKLLDTPAPHIPILGDAHALNAGTFRGPEGKTVWGLNDFDQAGIGSPEWDLERLGVSLYVASRSSGQSSEDSMKLVREMGKSYLSHLGESGPSFLSRQESVGPVADLIDKSAGKTQEKLLSKWVNPETGKLVRNEDLEEPETQRGSQVKEALAETFPDLKFLDLASKPHSGGSTRGLERYYALVEGEPEPWLMEIKAVLPSPVQIPDGDLSRGDGSEVIRLQDELGGHTDSRHKSFQLGDISFFTREREREKGSLKEKPEHLQASAENIGRVLARAHGKSGADLKGWIDGKTDDFLDNLGDFSKSYARQVESDYRAWTKEYAPTETFVKTADWESSPSQGDELESPLNHQGFNLNP